MCCINNSPKIEQIINNLKKKIYILFKTYFTQLLMIIYCRATRRDGETPCGNECDDGDRFCTQYHAYFEDYTEEMLSDLIYCKRCKKWIYSGYFNGKTCRVCLAKKKKETTAIIEKRNGIPKCLKCENPVINNTLHCGRHKHEQYIYEVNSRNNKLCKSPNCISEIPNDDQSDTCDICIMNKQKQKAQKAQKAKRHNTKIAEDNKSDTHDISIINKQEINERKIEERVDETLKNMLLIKLKCDSCMFEFCLTDMLDQQGVFVNLCRCCINDKTSKKDMTDRTMSERFNVVKTHIKNLDITENDFNDKINEPCFYCKSPSTNVSSIDNVNYDVESIVSICDCCFKLKGSMSHDMFMIFCKNIFENYDNNDKLRDDIEFIKFKIFKDIMKSCKRVLRINKVTYDNYTNMGCVCCNNTNKCIQNDNSKTNVVSRVDPYIGYVVQNTYVPMCLVCYSARGYMYLEEFYNHVIKILKTNDIITNVEYESSIKPKKKLTQIQNVAFNLNQPKIKNHKDRRKCATFRHESKYYISMIWNGINIDDFFPELEFCSTPEQKDIWKFYRICISSYRYQKGVRGRHIEILIRDFYTKKYVGIASLSSINKASTILDKEIGWPKEIKMGRVMRINNVMNITTCVAIPPFSNNFNGGKLIAKLMFSKEVFNYFYECYNQQLVGIVTYSLHGRGYQYDGINELKFIGLTNGFGMDVNFVNNDIHKKIKLCLINNNGAISNDKMLNVSNFCNRFGIDNACYHGKRRGIYIGYTTPQSKKYLCSNDNSIIIDASAMRSVRDISIDWIKNIATKRFRHLVDTLSVKFVHNYDYYWTDTKSYARDKKKADNIDNKEDIKNDIVKLWDDNNQIPVLKISKFLTDKFGKPVGRPLVESILHKYSDMSDDNKIFQNDILSDIRKNNNANYTNKKINVDEVLRREFLKTNTSNKNKIIVKKPNMYILLNTHNIFTKFHISICDLMKGEWSIDCIINESQQVITLVKKDVCMSDTFQAIEYVHDFGPKRFSHIMFAQTSIDNIKVLEEAALAHGCNVTSKGNMIIRNHYKVQYVILNIVRNTDMKIIKLEIILNKESHYCKCYECKSHNSKCRCDRCIDHMFMVNKNLYI